MTAYEVLSLLAEAYVAGILTVEYFFGRSDMDMKSEVKRKKKMREKYRFEVLNDGEGK
jgi:hypothetical protein